MMLKKARERADEDDLGLTYSRISKSIRQTVMLHAKFEDDANKTDEQRQAFAETFLVPTRTLRPRTMRVGLRFDF